MASKIIDAGLEEEINGGIAEISRDAFGRAAGAAGVNDGKA